jgi:hypothetical protein
MTSAVTGSLPVSANMLDDEDLVFYDAPESVSTPAVTAAIASIPPTIGISNLINIAIPAGTLGGVTETLGVGSSIASLSISHAGISGRLVPPSKWGTYNGKPATLLKAKFEFSSPRDCILKSARVEITFEPMYRSSISPAPRIRGRAPSELRSAEPTKKQIARGQALAPKFNAGGFAGGEIGQLHSDQNFSQVEGWSIISNVGATDPTCPESKVWWDLSSNVLQHQGVKHHLAIALVVEHVNEPFYAVFRLSGKQTKRSWVARLMGKKNKNEVSAIKKLDPEGKPVFADLGSVDLEELVKENLVPTRGKLRLFI